MTETEARAFLQAVDDRSVCVSYVVERDGAIRFKPASPDKLIPVGSLQRRPPLAVIGLGLALAGTSPVDPTANEPSTELRQTVGELAARPAPLGTSSRRVAGGLMRAPEPLPSTQPTEPSAAPRKPAQLDAPAMRRGDVVAPRLVKGEMPQWARRHVKPTTPSA